MGINLRIDPASMGFTIKALGNQSVTMKRAQRAAVRAAGQFLLGEIKFNLSGPKSLRSLAVMDHPYARRHGSIRLDYGTRGGRIRDGRHVVNKQSGKLLRALTGQVLPGRRGAPMYQIRVNMGLAPHWRFIVSGTGTMLPRDPMWETVNGPATLRGLRLSIIRVLGKEMRSQAHIRFNPRITVARSQSIG